LKQRKSSISEHLASLSVQYGVYPAELFQALVAAKECKTASCHNLTVECRGTIDNEAIFLLKQDGKVVGQFRVDESTLLRKDLEFANWMEDDKIRRQIAKQNPSEPVWKYISDLRHGMKKVNLEAKVTEIQQPRMVHTQFGNSALLANATIEDETGTIKLCLWDQQVNAVAAGDEIKVENATVFTFKGEKQLRLGKAGTVTVTKSAPAKTNAKVTSKTLAYAS
jgi:replication factor A1